MRIATLFATLLTLALCLHVDGQFYGGWIAGAVRGAEQDSKGIDAAQVSLRTLDGKELLRLTTDASGNFSILAIPPNDYELRFFKPGYSGHTIRPIRVQSFRGSFVDVEMQKSPASVTETWRGKPVNPWGSDSGSVFERSQLDNLVSPRNIWAILENLDPSSVTNRVDEGGIETGVIALVGVNGSSWTQNTYRLDGINVTDPYEGGRPLVYPDYGSLQEFDVDTAFHRAAARVPGAEFRMTSREGGSELRAEAEGYYLGQPFQSSNLDERLRGWGYSTTQRFKRFGEGRFGFSGPAPRFPKWSFFTSFAIQHRSKILPDFSAIPASDVYSGLMRFDGNLSSRDQLTLMLAGQIVNNSRLGARPGISPSSTLRGNDRFEIVQGRWTRRKSALSAWDLSFGFSHASPTDTFHRNITEPNRTQLFTEEMTGAPPIESDLALSRFSLVGHGQRFGSMHSKYWQNRFDYGFDLEESITTEEHRVLQGFRLLFFPKNVPVEVIEYNTPSRTKQRLREFSLPLDDHLQIFNRLFVRFGVNFDRSNAFLPKQRSGAGPFAPVREFPGTGSVVSWTTVSPRASVAVPVSWRFGDMRLTASFSRYHHVLPAMYANFANPNALGGRVLRWQDKNQDGEFQPGEEGALLAVFGGPNSSVDPELKRPFTNEWGISLEQNFGREVQASLRLLRRDTKRLVETINVGVPESAFTPVRVLDAGDDNISGTKDDQILTVFNQDPRTLGQDRFLLTNPKGLNGFYKNFQATIRARFARQGFAAVSFSAYEAAGNGSPGNAEFDNDTGVIGPLFDNPNTLLNSRGRLFFDRAYTGKIALYHPAPRGFHFSSVIKYFDGLPFGRKLIIPDFNQGPFFVMATPRGQPGGLRTQYNLTFDLRIGRDSDFGRLRLSLFVDVFNLLNLNKNLREFDITGPLFPLRRPLEVQNPRVIRFGVRLRAH